MELLIFSFLTNILYYCSGNLILNQKKNDFHSLFYIYFVGVVTISILSLLLNFFVKLSSNLNTIIYFCIILLYALKSKFYTTRKNFIFLILSSFVTLILVIYSTVNRPDAGLYHLPYISIINDSKIIIGASNIHFRFGHVSIIQYLSAVNLNSIFGDKGIVLPLASLISFFYIYFFYDLFKIIKGKEINKASDYFSLFVSIYIVYKISRYSGFGNDAVAHLSFFYLISYVLKNRINKLNINKLLLISTFIFINKVTLIFSFLIPLILFFYKKKKNLKNISLLVFSPASLILFLWFLKNVLVSGCAIYPVKLTCISNLSWTNINQVEKVSVQSEAWSKGWPDRIDKEISYKEFNKNFYWLKSWSNKHLKYIIKILLPFVMILIFTYFVILSKSSKSNNKSNKDLRFRLNLSILIVLLGTISFFLLFPLYRYGYSLIISLIILLFIYFGFNLFDKINDKKIFKYYLIICLIFFVLKHTNRIYQDKENDLWPNIYTLNNDKIIFKKSKLKIDENFYYYLSDSGDNLCMYSKAPCTSYKIDNNIKIVEKFGYFILVLKNKENT